MTLVHQLLVFLILFQIKHFIADGPLQTKAMVDEKSTYGAPLGLVHAGIHAIGTFIAAWLALGGLQWALTLAIGDGIIHYHVDFTKENIVKRVGWTVADGPFWWALTADQMAHQLTYIFLAWITFQP